MRKSMKNMRRKVKGRVSKYGVKEICWLESGKESGKGEC